MYSVLLKCPFLVNEGLLEGLTTCWAVKQTRAVCNKDRAVCNKEPLWGSRWLSYLTLWWKSLSIHWFINMIYGSLGKVLAIRKLGM